MSYHLKGILNTILHSRGRVLAALRTDPQMSPGRRARPLGPPAEMVGISVTTIAARPLANVLVATERAGSAGQQGIKAKL